MEEKSPDALLNEVEGLHDKVQKIVDMPVEMRELDEEIRELEDLALKAAENSGMTPAIKQTYLSKLDDLADRATSYAALATTIVDRVENFKSQVQKV